MELKERFRRAFSKGAHKFGSVILSAAAVGVVPAYAQVAPVVVADIDLSNPETVATEEALLREGVAFESSQEWAEAVRHYTEANRDYPQNRSIYQRLLISRLHFDVNRRYQDVSYLKSVRELSTEQTLDLYSEVLANLQTHYVEQVDWKRVQTHGTAALEVALTQDAFLDRIRPTASDADIEAFRQAVHREFTNRSTQTRYDLRANVAHVAALTHDKLGVSGTATVLEYISGAISTLDTYTRLLSGNQLDEMFSNIEGNFVGLGIELKPEKDSLRILNIIPGGPASESGMKRGEEIIGVDDQMTTNVAPSIAADLLRGPEYSDVKVHLRNPSGKVRTITVQRRRVDVPSVQDTKIADQATKTGYLKLTNFQKTTPLDVETALWSLHRQGMRSLIIDVRGNPGGLLSAAVEVADRFLAQGRIVTTRGRNIRENFEYTAKRQNTWADLPLVVLIDGDSASASEIFAGAIADSKRGEVIGETSYGKGSVQGIFRMQSAKFGLCMTTAKFYSPSGRAISLNGVIPSITVASEGDRYSASRPSDDGGLIESLANASEKVGPDAVLDRAVQHLTQQQRITRRP